MPRPALAVRPHSPAPAPLPSACSPARLIPESGTAPSQSRHLELPRTVRPATCGCILAPRAGGESQGRTSTPLASPRTPTGCLAAAVLACDRWRWASASRPNRTNAREVTCASTHLRKETQEVFQCHVLSTHTQLHRHSRQINTTRTSVNAYAPRRVPSRASRMPLPHDPRLSSRPLTTYSSLTRRCRRPTG